ncbi:MAG TPA: carboxypeptidase-like regulatory domain-containing protein, partial [Prolixibacteraceae bacterium]|nr:carboxypeptidase-like regulatory domain-containing protein [Prolixibacteraceae bacterium]
MQNFMKSDYFTFQGKKPLVKKALFLLGLLLVSVAQTLSAQNTFTYSGLVKAENGDALPGVNVVEKGTVNGTITDFDGAFQITTTKASSTFTFSMVGYETIESTIKPGVKAAIVMKESVVGLGEVLVVGYGVQKRSNITGAISKMDNKTISQLPTNNVNQALQGRIAGVNALNTSGSPGAATKLVIRGVG